MVFNVILRTSPKDKTIFICERLGGLRKLLDSVGFVLFERFKVKHIFNLLSNALPLYAVGVDTGITVDCGFQHVEIMPFCQAQLCVEGYKICYAGGVHIEKNLSKLLKDDNIRVIQKMI